MVFEREIKNILKKLTKLKEVPLEKPPSNLGDYAFPCFILSKKLKKKPHDIAKDLAKKIKKDKIISKVEVKGPYLNFFIKKDLYVEEVLKQKIFFNKTKKTVVIESPGPNTNKPLHLGHIRNGLLGLSLRNLLKKTGNKVINVDIINDRGIHISKSMLAYQKYGKNQKPNIKKDHFVGKYYVLFNQKVKENPQLEKEAQELLKKWEKRDPKIMKLWKQMNEWCIEGMQQTYERLGLKIEKAYRESQHFDKGKKIVLAAFKKGVFKKDPEGAIIIDLEKNKLGKKVLLRADGTSIYITQDIALAKKRYEDFKMNKMIYVVAREQEYHFKVLFKVLQALKFPFSKACYHLSYGMVNLPEGKMKSREGTVVDADDLIDEMKEAAKKELKKRYKLKEKELDKRAELIGLSAIKFYILKYDPVKDFVYDPKESISFEGETGPYIQYTHARINSILTKYGDAVTKKVDYSLLKEKEELELIKLIGEFKSKIEESAHHYKPSIIARYLLDLSQAFNNYYHKHQILKSKINIRKARILLVSKVKDVLKEGLSLLGIDAIDIM
jgi:arginyl-tRNA synthetase